MYVRNVTRGLLNQRGYPQQVQPSPLVNAAPGSEPMEGGTA